MSRQGGRRKKAGDRFPSGKLRQVIVLSGTGPFMFNADQTYAVNLTVNGTAAFNFPGSCLSGLTCDVLSTAVQAQVAADPASPFQSASCAGSGDCTCTFVLLPETIGETGTYTVSGSSLLTTSNGTTDTLNYCVKGSSVVFREPAMAGMTSEISAIIAQKQ